MIIQVLADTFDEALKKANARALEECEGASHEKERGGYLRFIRTELYVRPWKNRQDETTFYFSLELQG